MQPNNEDISNRTVYCSNLPDQVTEELLYELFLQAGPVDAVRIPRDKDGKYRRFGFVEFKHAVSVPYCIEFMKGVSLFGKDLQVKPRHGSTYNSPQPNLDNQFHKSRSAPDIAKANMANMEQVWPSPHQNQMYQNPFMAMHAMQAMQANIHLPSPIGHMQRSGTLPVQPLILNSGNGSFGYGNQSPNFSRNDCRNSSGANTPEIYNESQHGSYSQRSYNGGRHHRREHSRDRNRPYHDRESGSHHDTKPRHHRFH